MKREVLRYTPALQGEADGHISSDRLHRRRREVMHAFNVLGNPVRRRILELLAEGERTSGAIGDIVQEEFGITQPAVSQHLKVLGESAFASARPEGPRRVYFVDALPLEQVDAWLERFRSHWEARLDALATEVARGKRRPVPYS